MDILVCVKRVPDTADAEVSLRSDGKGIRDEDLAFGLNEWDTYAVEEAIRLKEKHGGSVAVVTVGSSESEEVLRRCLAMGADEAFMIDGKSFQGADPYRIARILAAAAKRKSYDLFFTGAQAADDGYGMVGPLLAAYLGIPHATLVTSISIEDGKALVTRELEGGLEEMLSITLPAVFTIQTGINEPRYVSIMGIRKVRDKAIPALGLSAIGLLEDSASEKKNLLHSLGLSIPPAGKEAVMLKGSAPEIAQRILDILREKGGVI